MAKSKKDGGQRYDWNAIKNDYVTDPGSSLKKMSEKYGVSFTTVKKHSKADDWLATKKKHQEKVRQKVADKIATRQANKLASEMMAADKLSAVVVKALNDELQFNRYLVQEGDLESGYVTVEKVFDKVDTRGLRDLAAVLKTLEEIKRSLYNIQKAEQLNKQYIERERLDLDKELFEFEKQKAEFMKPDVNNSIRIEGMEKGWAE